MKILLVLLLSFSLLASKKILIDVNLSKIEKTSNQRFKSRDNALALNVNYSEVLRVRTFIENSLNLKLTFFKGWNPLGEAHVTVITPPEMDVLKAFIKPSEINNIARKHRIQFSDIKILGIGSGKNDESKTFFIIVESKNLLKIREEISKLYIKRSKKIAKFNPKWFFPHITIDFTKKDLHEHNGVIKSMAKSFDKRFILK